jgi:hypothetical protein
VPRRAEATHKLVPLEDALRLTGLGRADLVRRPDTQHLVSIDSAGKRAEFVQVPIALLGLKPEGVHEPSGEEDVVVSLGAAGTAVHLSKKECWELYVLLDDDAPFVRHQLSVVRHGGHGGVSLTSATERRQVLERLLSSAGGVGTAGLAALREAIAEAQAGDGSDEVVRG